MKSPEEIVYLCSMRYMDHAGMIIEVPPPPKGRKYRQNVVRSPGSKLRPFFLQVPPTPLLSPGTTFYSKLIAVLGGTTTNIDATPAGQLE